MLPITQNINAWLATGERGISSEAIVSHLTGINIVGSWGKRAPYDPDDFRRCWHLITACPEVEKEFHRMSEVSPVWKSLVGQWKELEALYLSKQYKGLYTRMKAIGC